MEITIMTTETPLSQKPLAVLRVDSSARGEDSTSRTLTDALIGRLRETHDALTVTRRDVADGLPFVTSDWVGANTTDPAERSSDQAATLTISDSLVAELAAADIVVIGVPIYNFSIPAALKAWIDMIARARVTFAYTEKGPVGLLKDKKAYLIVTSGRVEAESGYDFATPYLKHVLGFIGIDDVTVIAADRQMLDSQAAQKAREAISALAA